MKKWNIGWGITSECNMHCQFCYSKFKRSKKRDLNYQNWIAFIDENWESINSINYGTGENCINNDWFQFINYVRNKNSNIKQGVTTNGYISQKLKDNIENLNIFNKCIDEVDVSLDFADLDQHGVFRGNTNAGDWVINTLELCKKLKKRVTIVMLCSKVNMFRENIDAIFQIALRYNALVRMNLYRPSEGINCFSKQFILPPEQLYNIIEYIASKYKVLSISDRLLSNIFTDTAENDPSGIDSLRILPDGNITPSTYLIDDSYIIGNIMETNILKKIEQSSKLRKLVSDRIPKECLGCRYVETCAGGVIDRRYLWNKTLEKKDPYCIIDKRKIQRIKLYPDKFQSIHHGYLPTMFFKA